MKKIVVLVLAFACSINWFFLSASHADQQVWSKTTFQTPDGFSFSDDSPFSIDVTGLYDDTLHMGRQFHIGQIQFGVWTGPHPNLYIDFPSVTQVSSPTCNQVDPYISNGINYFRAQCFGLFTYVKNDTYRFALKNDPSLGSHWYQLVVTDLDTNQVYKTTSVYTGTIDLKQFIGNLVIGNATDSDNIECSSIPIFDTIYSNFRFGSIVDDGSEILENNTSSCGQSTATPNLGSAAHGGVVVKLGGSDVSSRNLEHAPPPTLPQPVLDENSNTGISSLDNESNLETVTVGVNDVLSGASVEITATSSSNSLNQTKCNISAALIINNKASCSLFNLKDGTWSITAVQIKNALVSATSEALLMQIDTEPIDISMLSENVKSAAPTVAISTNKAGIGYLVSSNLVINNLEELQALPNSAYVKFAIASIENRYFAQINSLRPGNYKLAFEDLAGNFAIDTTDILNIPTQKAKIVAKSYRCVRGLKTISESGTSGKCPQGYLLKN